MDAQITININYLLQRVFCKYLYLKPQHKLKFLILSQLFVFCILHIQF